MLKCIHCVKEFKYESERKRHQESHFPQYECTVCAKKFSFLSALRRHRKQHERKGSVRCCDCGGSFRDETLLKRHIQYAHTGTYSCLECSSTFSSEQALCTHSKTHKPESERRFRCTFEGCKKAFNFPHHLKHHKLTHTNDKQHFCNVCGKGFIQFHHLKTHLKTHYPDNWLLCSVQTCKKTFATNYAFSKHMTTHSRVIECNTALRFDSGISSDSNSANDTHEKIEMGENILCATCGKLILMAQYLNHTLKCTLASDLKDNDLENVLGNYEVNVASRDSSNGDYSIDAKVEVNPKRLNCFKEMYSTGITAHKDTATRQAEDILCKSNATETSNACVGCPCADGPSPPYSSKLGNAFPSKTKALNNCEDNNMPKIEYTESGIVKIREFLDADIVNGINMVNEEEKEMRSDMKIETYDYKTVPFNSCKAVLGNCIVSEDGSVGEGCLCAKMIVDEQQTSAQEIDELTPHPNVS